MKALVKYDKGVGKIELREWPKPQPKRNEVLLRIKSCGICGTDIKIYDDHFIYDPPVILGHEFSGIVEEIGSDVCNVQIGDRVIGEQHVNACGVCSYCLSGMRHWCKQKRSPGYLSHGAFAQYMAVEASLLHVLPEQVSYDEAALVEPMGVCAYAILERAKVLPGETVVILGCGSLSLLAVQMVLASGAGRVFVTGVDADEKQRFKMALDFGAEKVINSQKEDPVEVIHTVTKGEGADLVIDLSGANKAILQGLDILKRNGRFCAIGLPADDVCIPWAKTVLKAITLIFSYSSDFKSWERCLGMIQNGKIKLSQFCNSVFTLDEWEDAFKKARSGDALKVIIHP